MQRTVRIVNKSLLTLYSYYAMCIPVHPGRGLGHDGDHRWGGCGACGFGETDIKHSGADGWSRGYYGPLRLKWLNNPSGKPQTPCDLGLCKCQPDSKNRRKSVDADFASTAGRHDRHSCELCVHATLRFSTLRKRHYRFHPGRSRAQRSLTSE